MPSPRVPTSVLAFGLWGAAIGALIGLAVASHCMARPTWIGNGGSVATLTVYATLEADGWHLHQFAPEDTISYAANIHVKTTVQYPSWRWQSSNPVTRVSVTANTPAFVREEGPGSRPRPIEYFPPAPQAAILSFITPELKTRADWLGWTTYTPAFGTSSTQLGQMFDTGFLVDAMLEFAGAGLFLGLFAAPFLGQRAQRRHLRLGLCPRCGYHKACDNCPECGTTDRRWRQCFIDLRTLTSPDTDTDTPAPMYALRHKSASEGRPLAYHRIDRQITPLFVVAGVWLAAIYMGDKLMSHTSASLGLVSTVLLWLTSFYLVVISVLAVSAITRVGRMQRRFGQTPNACLACLHPIPPDTRVCPACEHFDNREDLEPGWKRLCVPRNNKP